MNVKPGSAVARIIAIGVLAAALGLAGCGRKGALDPPPSAAVNDPDAAAPTERGPATDAQGKPLAPAKGPKKPFILDWLVD